MLTLEVSMLQALKLDSPAPAVKSRAGTGSSDPAEAVFAGMMAQAATPSAPLRDVAPKEAPPRTMDRVEQSETPPLRARDEVPQEPKVKPEAPPEDPAKAAVTEASSGENQDAEPAATSMPPAEAAAAPATVPLPSAPAEPSQAAPSSTVPAVASAPVPAVQSEPAAEGSVARTAAPTLPQGLHEEASEAPATDPAALRELLFRPKAEMDTPRLQPAAAAATPGEAKKTAAVQQPSAPAAEETSAAETPAPLAMTNPAGEPLLGATGDKETAASHTNTTPHGGSTSPGMAMAHATTEVKAAATPTPAEAVAASRPAPVLAQVEGTIRWILQSKTQGAELQLHPESLGKVTIRLTVEGQDVHARLWVSETSSLAVLHEHRSQLESSLREQGLNLSSFDLQSGARGDGAHTASQEKAPASAFAPSSAIQVEQEMPIASGPGSADPRRLEIYA